MSTRKYVVMAVLEENKIGEITPEMEDFRGMLRSVHSRNLVRYRDHFQFGWTGEPGLANSVAMETLALPNLIVINSTTFQHYLPDDDPVELTAEAIQIFLDGVLDNTVPVYGGSTYSVRWVISSSLLFPLIDPRGRTLYYTCCPSVPTFQNRPKTKIFTAGWACGLALWIIDDSCLVPLFVVTAMYCMHHTWPNGLMRNLLPSNINAYCFIKHGK